MGTSTSETENTLIIYYIRVQQIHGRFIYSESKEFYSAYSLEEKLKDQLLWSAFAKQQSDSMKHTL
jgi:hypothetical protein